MKKSSRKKIKIAFWAVFALGCAWLVVVPPRHVEPPVSITVKVEKPVEPVPPPEADEPHSIFLPEPPPKPSGGEEQEPSAGVTVPVTPEPEEKPVKGQKAKIAIVIDDVGVDLKGSEKAIKLPAPITLSFLPYAIRLREQAKEAREGGHELLLHMPMEPIGHEDPGPGALLVDLPMRDLQQRFEAALASFTGFDGVNNHMGSKFTTYSEGMNMVVDELQQRHLFFLDSRTSATSVGKAIAEQTGLPTVSRDVFLDDVQTPDSIQVQLEATEHIARRKGFAIAIGHPHATTMEVLKTWIPEAEARGFVFVPLNSLVKNTSETK